MTKIKGLLIMDVDSTLIQEEGIDLLGELAGSGPEIADITHRAMNGELDFAESLHARVGLLAGLPVSVFDTIRKQIHFTDGESLMRPRSTWFRVLCLQLRRERENS